MKNSLQHIKIVMKKTQKTIQIFLVVFVLMLNSCNNNKSSDNTGGITHSDNTEVINTPVYQDLTQQEIIDFVETWKKIYTTHTFDNYIKMYDMENFRGIKRTYSGERNEYDYNGWRNNKRNEFQKFEPEVIVENVKVKYLNQNGRSKVSFIQTWVSYKATYADKGEKVLILKKINGEIFIENEELLYSEPVYDYFGT